MTTSRVLVSAIALGVAVTAWLGCSSDKGPNARVALASNLGASQDHPQDVCKLSPAPWITIGKLGENVTPGDPTVPVNSGDAWDGHTVTATACNVTTDGDGFQVNVSVTVDGVGSFSVNGHVTTTPPVTPVQGIFQRSDTGSFRQDDCTITYPRPEMGVAGGRVWGRIDCPNATFSGQSRVCNAYAEFRFENCNGA
jgi:hypothetical protein